MLHESHMRLLGEDELTRGALPPLSLPLEPMLLHKRSNWDGERLSTFGGYSASGDAPRMTEGEGSTAAIDDAAANRPSPANSPRVAAILSPLSLRPLRLF